MAGIVSYGAYIPLFRLPRSDIGKAWGTAADPGEIAVRNYDEDSLTMAVAASIDCLQGVERNEVEGFFLASTTLPYREKMVSTTGALALDLRRQVRTADLASSLRCGTGALLSALDAVKAGTMKNVLVAAADSRQAMARGELEFTFGDGAAALLVGDTNVVASIEASYSISDEITDIWRSEDDSFVRFWEDRFGLDEGYRQVMPEAVSGLLSQCNMAPKDVAKAVFYGPNARRHAEMTRLLGFSREQVQDEVLANVGNTGAALPLMMLVAALEEARPGDRILLASYGNGCDALLLRVTPEIEKIKKRHQGIKGNLASKRALPNYEKYLLWRGLVPMEPPRRPDREPTSWAAVWRERQINLPLYATRCKRCGTQQFPLQRVCVACQSHDEYELFRLSDKRATIFTYTIDNLAAAIDPPTPVVVVDFDGGGRYAFDMTDVAGQEVEVGMPMEFSFRKLYFERGIHNYFWKVRTPRYDGGKT